MLPNVDTRDHKFIVIALEFVLTIEILMTNKNNEMLVYDAYTYFKHRILTDTSTFLLSMVSPIQLSLLEVLLGLFLVFSVRVCEGSYPTTCQSL